MIPVDLNRLREAVEGWDDEVADVVAEVAVAVLDAPTVWWCEQGHGICVDVTEKLIERGDETAIAFHSRCGLRALVPVKGES